MSRTKLPLVERFSGKKIKLKGFLIQIKLKIRYKGVRLLLVVDQVVYIGLFLIGRALK